MGDVGLYNGTRFKEGSAGIFHVTLDRVLAAGSSLIRKRWRQDLPARHPAVPTNNLRKPLETVSIFFAFSNILATPVLRYR
jgi:hypothetical protein